MKTKITLAVCTALYVSGATFASGLMVERSQSVKSPAVTQPSVKPATRVKAKNHLPQVKGNQPPAEKAAAVGQGPHTYIITFIDEPVARYKGGVAGLAATHKSLLNSKQNRNQQYQVLTGEPVDNAKQKKTRYIEHPNVQAYRKYLDNSQKQFIAAAAKKLGRDLKVSHRYQLAINGIAVKITPGEAAKLQSLPGIKQVRRETKRQMHTDIGPNHIGANNLWQGMVNNLPVKGEGITVGILDSGINTDHVSFQKTGADGYQHSMPGEGSYLGDCVTEPTLCNDKLIGVFSYPDVTENYNGVRPANGEDYNGHGSHTASTVAGNVLNDVPLLSPSSEETSDGFSETDFSFDSISGVAPHANIVSFQVCLPGDPGDILAGCFPSLTAQAVEDAIANDIDVLNYSVGGGSSDPWADIDAQAFLSAREAGIVVITSAGNSGPEAGTVGSPADAPWMTSVGAFTHGRTFERKLSDFAGGENAPTDAVVGLGQPGRIRTAEIVYAGNAPYNDPMCLQPLTEHRVSQKIVVCDRGEIPLGRKSR